MKNTFINKYRKEKRENTGHDQTEGLFYLNQTQVAGNDPVSHLQEKEILKKVEALPDEFKIPFEMHTRGYKYQEIADHLQLKIGTVKSRIFFARQKLMKELHDYAA